MAEINTGGTYQQPAPGHAGIATQLGGQPTTVSTVGGATGGIEGGNLLEPEVDQQIVKFNPGDTALMTLMLYAKNVKVESPIVEHYMLDEARSSVFTASAVTASTQNQIPLPLSPQDQQLLQASATILVKGVNGYTDDGQTATPGKYLQLFVKGHDTTSGNPVVCALNGPKTNAADEFCTIPAIPAGSECFILGNALYETQGAVDPDLIVPQPTKVYLQKFGMSQIVSDYFESQKKRIPFSNAVIAEAAISKYKKGVNRTLYIGRKSHFKVNVPKLGVQDVYTTEGVRYQVKRELKHVGAWTFDEVISLAKLVFTGPDVPTRPIMLCGDNLLESIQKIDYSKHPEVQIITKENPVGWSVTAIHTVFGDIEIKREPTMEEIGCSNSAFVVDPERLVYYNRSAEHKRSENIEGEEAKRESVLMWVGLALKGASHLWIDGEGEAVKSGAENFKLWDKETAPESPVTGMLYYLVSDCPGINASAHAGELWKYENSTWKKHTV